MCIRDSSSTSTVQSHLNALEKFGYIKRDPNKNRAITVLEDTKPSISVDGNETSSSDNFEFLGAGLKQVPLIGTVPVSYTHLNTNALKGTGLILQFLKPN